MLRLRILATVFPVIGIGWRYARVKRPATGVTNQVSTGSQPA